MSIIPTERDKGYNEGVKLGLAQIKRVATDFADWCADNNWHRQHNGLWHRTFEQATAMSEKTYKENYIRTTNELFEMYIDRTKKCK